MSDHPSLAELDAALPFVDRHIGLRPEDIDAMLETLGFDSLRLVSVWEENWEDVAAGKEDELAAVGERGQAYLDAYLKEKAAAAAAAGFQVETVVKVPAPPEGVIDRALVGTTRSGPWLQYVGNTGPAVSGRHTTLWVRFRFLYPPQGRRVELVWKLRWNTVIGKVDRRYANTIDTYASSTQPLPKGVWLVVLKIDGRVAKRMNVRLL